MKGDKMKIAFYDSGMGGLSVLNHAMHILPNEEYLYFADVDNVPLPMMQFLLWQKKV